LPESGSNFKMKTCSEATQGGPTNKQTNSQTGAITIHCAA